MISVVNHKSIIALPVRGSCCSIGAAFRLGLFVVVAAEATIDMSRKDTLFKIAIVIDTTTCSSEAFVLSIASKGLNLGIPADFIFTNLLICIDVNIR